MEQLDESAAGRPESVVLPAGAENAVDDEIVATAVGDEGATVVTAPVRSAPDRPATDEAPEPVLTPVIATDALSLTDVHTGAYAQVLHDEPLQLVIAAMLHLDSLPDQYRLPSVQRAVDLLERATDRMRQLVHAMGLADERDTTPLVVQRAVEALLGGRGVRFEHVGDPEVPLSAAGQQAARAILVAALSDIGRRASVTTVTLDLRTEGDTAVITLRDDGTGLLPPVPRPVTAPLADLRARAAAVGGTLDAGPDSTLRLLLPTEPGGSVPATS